MKAVERIANKESQILYRKVGRKYVKNNDPYAYDGLRDGWHLIKVDKGCTSIRSCVYPDRAEIIAAMKDKEDKIIEIIRKASEPKPQGGVKMSEQAAADWNAMVKNHGNEFSAIYYPSFQENAEKIVAALLDNKYD